MCQAPFAAVHVGELLEPSLGRFELVPSVPIDKPGSRGTEPPGRACSHHSWELDVISRNLDPKPPALCGPPWSFNIESEAQNDVIRAF